MAPHLTFVESFLILTGVFTSHNACWVFETQVETPAKFGINKGDGQRVVNTVDLGLSAQTLLSAVSSQVSSPLPLGITWQPLLYKCQIKMQNTIFVQVKLMSSY